MQRLPTWGGKKQFLYEGSIQLGTTIIYGRNFRARVSPSQYKKLLENFKGKCVSCGTSRTNRSRDSLGEWLVQNVTKTAIASYVAAILVHENYAKKVNSSIQFKSFTI